MAKTLLQELKESIRQRFNSRNKINIEKKANAVVKNLAKQKLDANLKEDIIKSVSPQPKKTNANVDLGYRSLY